MTKVLVLYYSSYGHVEMLAHEIGARKPGRVRRGEARS
jgi:flavodoxin